MYINRRNCLSWLLILVVVAGCEWDYPLSQPADAVAEARLMGPWKVVANYDYGDPSGAVKRTPTSDELSILNIMNAPEKNVFIVGFTEFHNPQLPEILRTHGALNTLGSRRSVTRGISILVRLNLANQLAVKKIAPSASLNMS